MKSRMALIFANLDNDGMDIFTSMRSLGAMPFAGRYRLIDFTLSNLVNSGVEAVGLAVRERYQSLLDHIGTAREWDLDRRHGGLTFLPPFLYTPGTPYDTKLKALLGSENFIRAQKAADYILLCDPDVAANMDLNALVEQHISSGNDVTYLTVLPSGKAHGTFDIAFEDDGQGRITDILPWKAGEERRCSTGILVLGKEFLLQLISSGLTAGYRYFELELLRRFVSTARIGYMDFEGAFYKIRTLEDYYAAGFAVLQSDIRRDLFFRNAPIYTKTHSDVPVLYGLQSDVDDSLVADGSVVSGRVTESILFRRVEIQKDAVVAKSIIMQDSVVEEGATVEYVVADKNVRITRGAVIRGTPEHPRLLAKGGTFSR